MNIAFVKQTTWKPISEGPPLHGGQVLVSWQFTNHPEIGGPFVSSCRYEMGHWDWSTTPHIRPDINVQAWMDHPEPYKN